MRYGPALSFCFLLVGPINVTQSVHGADQENLTLDPSIPRESQYVYVLPPFGIHYHRKDHLRIFGVEGMLPEAARKQGYRPDPVCNPPATHLEYIEEAEKGERVISQYYRDLLLDRAKALSEMVPVGQTASPVQQAQTARATGPSAPRNQAQTGPKRTAKPTP